MVNDAISLSSDSCPVFDLNRAVYCNACTGGSTLAPDQGCCEIARDFCREHTAESTACTQGDFYCKALNVTEVAMGCFLCDINANCNATEDCSCKPGYAGTGYRCIFDVTIFGAEDDSPLNSPKCVGIHNMTEDCCNVILAYCAVRNNDGLGCQNAIIPSVCPGHSFFVARAVGVRPYSEYNTGSADLYVSFNG